MTKQQLLAALQQAMATIQRAFALLDAKDAEIARLREQVAMFEYASSARKQLERAKVITDRIM
jgi:hypothetical protein